MIVYENYDSEYSFSNDSVNAYVGGDAYNYIINGTYTTAYFVLAGICLLFAVGMLILDKLNQLIPIENHQSVASSPNTSIENIAPKEKPVVIEKETKPDITKSLKMDSIETPQNKSKSRKINTAILSAVLLFLGITMALNFDSISNGGNASANENSGNSIRETYDKGDYEQVLTLLNSIGDERSFRSREYYLF